MTAEATEAGAVPGLKLKQGGLGSGAQMVALATLCAVLFLTFLDNTVVSVGLADVQSQLHAGIISLQWVVNGYALVFASLMLAAGSLGDLLGRKKVMLVGVGVFCAGSVVAATATNIDWLIVGRVVMGIGAAASEPGTLSIIRHVYPDKKTRADALGIWAAVSGLALALGPVIGGVLVGIDDWRAIFWFNLAIGVVAFTMSIIFVPETSDRGGRRIDFPGIFLGALVLASASFAVIQGEQSGYRTWWIIGLFVLSAVTAGLFVLVENKVRDPMLDLTLFRRPPFTGSNFVAFAAYFGTFSIFFFTALYVEIVANATPYQIAIDFVPMAAALIITSALTGPLVAKIGPRIPMTIGCILAAVGIIITRLVLSPHVDFGALGAVLPIAGIGFGMTLVPVTSTPLTVVKPERSGMAASATNTSRELGAVFGVAVLGSLVDGQLTTQLTARLKASGIPASYQSYVLKTVTSGGLGGNSEANQAEHSANATVAKIATKVVNAAYDAFGAGLHLALEISGGLLIAGAIVAALTIHRTKGETYDI